MKYSEAILEIEEIVRQLEDEQISIDDLSEQVRKATALIKYCREILYKTESEISEALKTLQNKDAAEE
ncbi:MAG: exodeoxyribonuclease VII small subunit [Bacteroidetes bacterium]|nr:exodeoxyribonuclease VII small subunit [Bacteroidota bacterium]MBU1720609.1 exodeoxyribonuclease VII small subunit [Bacteroidota bacterium]